MRGFPSSRGSAGLERPGSFSAALEFLAGRRGLFARGFVAHVPHYLAAGTYAPAALAVLERIREATGLALPPGDLAARSLSTLAQLEGEVSGDGELGPLVTALEEQYDDLVAGDNCFFAATGITDGELLKGVHYDSRGATTQSLVMRSQSGTVRLVNARHRLSKLKEFSSIEFGMKIPSCPSLSYTISSTGMMVPSYSSDVIAIPSLSPCMRPAPTTRALRGIIMSSTAIGSSSRSFTACPSVMVWFPYTQAEIVFLSVTVALPTAVWKP